MARQIVIQDWGLIDYQQAYDKQTMLLESLIEYKKQEPTQAPPYDYLILCEHPPVYTLGKSGKIDHLLITEQELQKNHIQFVHTNRGGDITFHGLGQIVAYPIIDLEQHKPDINFYIRNLEQVIINTLKDFNVEAHRSAGETGVWLHDDFRGHRKICAIGVKCSRWVTMHGLALNVNTNLNYFNHIIPCGIQHKSVTSLSNELNQTHIDIENVKQIIIKHFCALFNWDKK